MSRRSWFRWKLAVYPAVAAPVLLAVVWALMDFSSQTQTMSSVARKERDCAHQVNEYSQSISMHHWSGKVTGVVPHYNKQRRQCLVQIRREKPENGGKSIYEEIVDPNSDEQIGLRIRTSGEQGMRDSEVVSGAPVRADDIAGAKSWFESLMK